MTTTHSQERAMGRNATMLSTDQPLKPFAPSRPTTKSIETRPRTAGAASVTSFSRPWPTKIVEQQLEQPPQGQPMAYVDGSQLFLFPTPSPRHPRSATLPASFTASSTSQRLSRIGIALGSPSQVAFDIPPRGGVDRSRNGASALRDAAPAAPSHAPPFPPTKNEHEHEQRPKIARKKSSWQNFRRIFHRKNPHLPAEGQPASEVKFSHHELPQLAELPGEPFYSPDLSATSPLYPNNLQNQPGPLLTRYLARSSARAEADIANIIRNASNSPVVAAAAARELPLRISSSPLPRSHETRRSSDTDKVAAEPVKRNDSPLSQTGVEQHQQLPKPQHPIPPPPAIPQLDLCIPDPSMERYSIMFEKLLLSPTEPKKSLLERRQSKVQNRQNHTLFPHLLSNETTDIPRPMSSPALQTSTRLPSLSLNLARPHSLQRSLTAPPGATSPLTRRSSKIPLYTTTPLTPLIAVTPTAPLPPSKDPSEPFHPPLDPSALSPRTAITLDTNSDLLAPMTSPYASSFGSRASDDGASPVQLSVATQVNFTSTMATAATALLTGREEGTTPSTSGVATGNGNLENHLALPALPRPLSNVHGNEELQALRALVPRPLVPFTAGGAGGSTTSLLAAPSDGSTIPGASLGHGVGNQPLAAPLRPRVVLLPGRERSRSLGPQVLALRAA